MLDALVARSLSQSFMAYEVRKPYWFFLTEKFNPVVYGVFSFEEAVLVLMTEKHNPAVYGLFSCEEMLLVLFDEEV